MMHALLSALLVAPALGSGAPGEPPAPTGDPTDAPTDEAPDPIAPDPIGRPAPGGPHHDLELLYADGRHAEVLGIAESRAAADPADAEITWHAARALFELAEAVEIGDTSVDKLALYTSMRDWAARGLAIAPDHPHLRFARGLAHARIGTTRGILSSLFLAKGVEEDWRFVADSGFVYSSLDRNEMLPCDALLTLGIFYRLLPDWWIVQAITGTRGDLDLSLAMLERADRCGPDRIGTVKELGVTRACIGTTRGDEAMLAAGRQAFERVLALEPDGRTDEIDQRHAAALLADPSLACAYSRDGQQKLDRGALPASTD